MSKSGLHASLSLNWLWLQLELELMPFPSMYAQYSVYTPLLITAYIGSIPWEWEQVTGLHAVGARAS